MKSTKYVVIILSLFLAINVAKTQTLSEIISNTDLNYFQMLEQVEENKATLLDNADEGVQKRYYRWQTFWDSRVDEKGSFETYGNQLLEYSKNYVPNKSPSNYWENLGPTANLLTHNNNQDPPWKWKHIGRVECIWVNPNDTSEIYIGSNSAGLWKTNDSGQNWRLLRDGKAFGVQDIAVDMTNEVMYIVTGIYANGLLAYGSYGGRIYKSTDWGEHWNIILNIPLEDMQYMRRIEISADQSIVYAISKDKVYKSHDFGDTWIVILEDTDAGFRELAQNPANPVQLCVTGQKCFYTTNNSGINWNNRYHKILNITVDNVWCDAEYSPSGTLWINACRYEPNKNKANLIKSYDNGDSLISTIKSKYIGGQAGATVGIKVLNDNLIYAAGGTMYKITNDGIDYDPVTTYNGSNTHADIRDICFPLSSNYNVGYIVTDGGVNRTTTGGNNQNEWKRIYGNLALNECYSIAISEQNPEIMLMGAHDNGTYKRFADGTWKHVYGGDGGTALINSFDDDIAFFNSNKVLKRSINGGDGFTTTIQDGYSFHDFPLKQSKNEASIYYTGSYNFERWEITKTSSTKLRQSYIQFGTYDPGSMGKITAIATANTNEDIVYFAADGTRDEGSNNPPFRTLWCLNNATLPVGTGNWWSFTYLTQELEPILRDCRITEIEVHPDNEDIVWITLGNFSEENKVFQTTDGGTTWTNISHDLANIPVNTVAYDDQLDQLYIGTDVGVFSLDNPTGETDQTWKRYGDFPLVIASDIKINRISRELVVATYGRGVWRADLGCFYNDTPLQITGNEPWDDSRSITQSVEILSGATLTISATANIKMSPDAKITVHPGGELIIDGGKLTNSCGEMWQGITVLGNSNLPQWNISNQGYLEVKNGAIIENAENAIYVGNPEAPWGTQNGGIVKIDGAVFRNNVASIEMPKYQNYAFNMPEIPTRNVSYIRNSTFETTDYLAEQGKTPYAFISLWGVDGVGITGNTFKNLNPESYYFKKRGRGIRTWSANFYARYNNFENLRHGVYSEGAGELVAFKIDNCNFSNNFNSVYVSGIKNIAVTRNIIDVPSNQYYPIGVFLNGCTGFQVEENNFSSIIPKENTGFVVRNSGTDPNEIYKNNFTNLYMACQTQGNNGVRDENESGLQFLCNIFDGNSINIYITEYTPEENTTVIHTADEKHDYKYYGIANNQGSKKISSGNKFYNQNKGIANYQAAIYYFHDVLDISSVPLHNTSNVYLYESIEHNECPSNFDNGGGGLPTEEELTKLENSINLTENYLEELTDKGETEETVYSIQTANNGQGNKLRKALLEISPTLSDTSMISSIEIETILPPVMLAQILSANPRSAKSDKVLNALTKREHPLPPPFMAEILLGRDSLSEIEAVASNLGHYKSERAKMVNDFTHKLRTDTVSQTAVEDLINFLSAENSLQTDYMLIAYFLYLHNVDNAEQLLSELPTKYELTTAQQEEYNLQSQLTNVKTDLIRQEKSYFEMDSIQKQTIYTIAENDKYSTGISAQNIISMVDGVEFTVGVVIPEFEPVQKGAEAMPTPIFRYELSPNPATDYFVVDYDLGIRKFSQANFLMFNSNNDLVLEMPITKPEYQLLVETEKYEAGIYTCKIFANNKQLSEKPIIIKADEFSQNEDIFNNTEIFAVYPNPAKNYIVVNYNIFNVKVEEIVITDNAGKTVKTQKITENSNQIKIITTDLSNGTYNISLQSGNKIIKTQKIVINK